jgi:hypothetical protein
MAVVDASPSRERLGRVVELLRGVEEDASMRWSAPRRGRRPVVRPRAFPRPTGNARLWDDAQPPVTGLGERAPVSVP